MEEIKGCNIYETDPLSGDKIYKQWDERTHENFILD